ncbi:hypothetical protein ACWCY1_36115, partial [Streptomyces goshikiensis]
YGRYVIGGTAVRPHHVRGQFVRRGPYRGVVRRPYSRDEAVFPGGVTATEKYWPPVRRIDGAFGDRNLVCSCPPLDEYDN